MEAAKQQDRLAQSFEENRGHRRPSGGSICVRDRGWVRRHCAGLRGQPFMVIRRKVSAEKIARMELIADPQHLSYFDSPVFDDVPAVKEPR